jgi:hypothetical protein
MFSGWASEFYGACRMNWIPRAATIAVAVVTRKAIDGRADMLIGPAVQRMIDPHIDMYPVVVEKSDGDCHDDGHSSDDCRTAETIEQPASPKFIGRSGGLGGRRQCDRAALMFMIQTAGRPCAESGDPDGNQTLAEAIETLQSTSFGTCRLHDESHLSGSCRSRHPGESTVPEPKSGQDSTKFREDFV